MDSYIDKILEIVIATARVRKSAATFCNDRYADLRIFISASQCNTDQSGNAPADDVLLHLFGIAANSTLTSVNRAPITGPLWMYSSSVLQGILSMPTPKDSLLKSTSQPSYKWQRIIRRPIDANECAHVGVPLLPAPGNVSRYLGPDPSSVDILINVPISTTIFTLSGTYGYFRITRYDHCFIQADAHDSKLNSVVKDANKTGVSYKIFTSESVPNCFLYGNNRIVPFTWIKYDGDLVICTAGPYRGYINLELQIMATENNNKEVVHDRYSVIENPSAFLPEPNEHGGKFNMMYKRFVTAMGCKSASTIGGAAFNETCYQMIKIITVLSDILE
ncbi:hypothetical protein PV327_001513 [Microctonus hyperodae]|uniref:Uncharacterized protein n=1 Tax=Microctonus hyperodae TaxID=165561 RepID=A0AA39L3A5_MICHY|nr:hypothetical protein PV327_001513 [Microctonus hyperodae]